MAYIFKRGKDFLPADLTDAHWIVIRWVRVLLTCFDVSENVYNTDRIFLCAHSRHSSNQITARIEKLSYGLDLNYVDPVEYGTWLIGLFPWILMFLFKGLPRKFCWSISRSYHQRTRRKFVIPAGLTFLTSFQNLAAETAAYLTTKHPDYAVLAARIAISNLHKETKKSFSHVIKDLYEYGALVSCPS
jgi:hypothetical protein